MKSTILIAAGVAVASASLSETQAQYLFGRYIEQFDKKYETNQVFSKYDIFKSNLDTILTHNANPNKTFTMGINQFADITTEEFASFNKIITSGISAPEASAPFYDFNKLGDNEVNWVEAGVVNPVRNQNGCSAGWAFSSIAALESLAAIKGKGLNTLSVQQLVDCASREGNNGCNGGLMNYAYSYIEKSGGVSLEKDYSYTGKAASCKINQIKPVQTVSGHSIVSQGQYSLEAAAMEQPVTVAVDATSNSFHFYASGVITRGCGTYLSHALTLVGMGKENDIPYYYLQNSWGHQWGDKGYIKIKRGDNVCGMENHNWNTIPKL